MTKKGIAGIVASGCREGNLRGIDVTLPYGMITAVTGVSGSGKSSFAFDTLYAEGRRQMLEALRAGGESFFTTSSCSPNVDYILGLPATIAIQQSRVVRSATSTMGTISKINPYLYSMFSVCGEILCKACAEKGVRTFNPLYRQICNHCGKDIVKYTPAHFSNMSPVGACPDCGGSGCDISVDESLLYPNQTLSIAEGGLLYGSPSRGTMKWRFFNELLSYFGCDLETPIGRFSNEAKVALLYGVKKSKKIKLDFPGLVPEILNLYKSTTSEKIRAQLSRFIIQAPCETCGGAGISREVQSVMLGGRNICDVLEMSASELSSFVTNLRVDDRDSGLIAVQRRKVLELCSIFNELGISYLTLNRRTASLSGGEMHRIMMASYLASQLSGVLYILDEPSTGLHSAEIPRLNQVLKRLNQCGGGNTVVVVEHNERVIRELPYIVEFGPGPSVHGGKVIYQGPRSSLSKAKGSITRKLLSGGISLSRRAVVDYMNADKIKIVDACSNNLNHVTVDLPLGCLVAITGASGSGKSSLLFDTFCQKSSARMSRTRDSKVTYIDGFEKISQVISCEQTPISNNSRSIVATYCDFFADIRELFAKTNLARHDKLTSADFSFNTKSGSCPTCGGLGFLMPGGIMDSVQHIRCPECAGRRYKNHIAGVLLQGLNITQVLDLDVDEALKFFSGNKTIARKIKPLQDVGLGYLRIGQPLSDLSGGELQRIKLSVHLAKGNITNGLYIFDEPSAGLHKADLQKIINIFDMLISNGNSVFMIEHNLDLIWLADYVVDMGPAGGVDGGRVVATGTPHDIMSAATLTGQELRKREKML